MGLTLWFTKDQLRNSLQTTMQNIDREGVNGRVFVRTEDICFLSFSDHSFDVIVSSLCLHNIKDKQQREKALLEMLRVLKPGGKFAIADIRFGKEYAKLSLCSGCTYSVF